MCVGVRACVRGLLRGSKTFCKIPTVCSFWLLSYRFQSSCYLDDCFLIPNMVICDIPPNNPDQSNFGLVSIRHPCSGKTLPRHALITFL